MSQIRTIPETYAAFAEWLKMDSARDELLGLIPEKVAADIRDRFYKDLEFGTGGLRGIMGAGSNRMNEAVVAMATQGLANYVRLVKPKQRRLSAVVCFDARHNSPFFGRVTAETLAGAGFIVHMFEHLRLTPEVSFAVRALKADVGVMITASHNPPEYNGYKAYWDDGGQMIPPHDQGVIAEVRKISDLSAVQRMDFDEGLQRGRIRLLGEEMDRLFLDAVHAASLDPEGNQRNGGSVKVVYTPLHGAGGVLAGPAMRLWGFDNFIEEPTQIAPDPDFPTIKSANPEDPAAFKQALKTAEKEGADIAVASDPDGDRMGLVARDGKGKMRFITGNQMAALFTYYVCERLTALGHMPPRPLVVTTIVTTRLMARIAQAYGVATEETLTGFKWIGNVATVQDQRRAAGDKKAQTFLFGCEESYGYLFGTHARDKDGIVSLCMAAEIARWAKEAGKTIPDVIETIYRLFGVYDESQISVYLRGETGMEHIQEIMDTLRADPPEQLAGASVVGVTDFLKVSFRNADGKRIRGPKQLPEANVLLFRLEGCGEVVARPSGTEPKIKFYFNLCDTEGAPFASKAEVRRRVKALELRADSIKDAFMEYVGLRR